MDKYVYIYMNHQSMKSSISYCVIIVVLLIGCTKSTNVNNVAISNLKKVVFANANDSVVTSFTYNSTGYLIKIEEWGSNMVGLSPSVSANASIVFQRNANGVVTNFARVYPSITAVLTTYLYNMQPFYIPNSTKLQYCINTETLDSTIYNYTGSYITESITYSKRFLGGTQPIFKYTYTYDAVGNLLTSKYYFANFATPFNLSLEESLTFNGYDTNQNSMQVLNHEESILALRPQYASPNNPLSESYVYGFAGGITNYTYSYNAMLPISALTTSTNPKYSGRLSFYY